MTAQRASGGTGVAGRAGLADHLHFTFEDPLSSLPETARNLLIAAKDIVAEEGFEALTLKTVSERAGENKAMVSYYFDNKAGLVAAVLDSVIHDEYLSSLDRMKDVAPGERIPRLVEEMRHMAESAEDFTVFYELLPHVLRRRPAAQRRHRRPGHPGRRRPGCGPLQPVPRARADARLARGGVAGGLRRHGVLGRDPAAAAPSQRVGQPRQYASSCRRTRGSRSSGGSYDSRSSATRAPATSARSWPPWDRQVS